MTTTTIDSVGSFPRFRFIISSWGSRFGPHLPDAVVRWCEALTVRLQTTTSFVVQCAWRTTYLRATELRVESLVLGGRGRATTDQASEHEGVRRVYVFASTSAAMT